MFQSYHYQQFFEQNQLADLGPLDTINFVDLSFKQQQKFIKKLALEIERFHQIGLVHRALYTKHLFEKNTQSLDSATIEVAFIDLAKARFSPLASWRAYFAS